MFYYIYIPIELPIIQFCANKLEVIFLRQVIANNFESIKAIWWLKTQYLFFRQRKLLDMFYGGEDGVTIYTHHAES